MKTKLIKFVAILGLIATNTVAQAQDIQERTIKFGHLNNTDHPTSMGVKKFAEIVAAKSGGKIKVTEFASSQLGNELQQQSALMGGRLSRKIKRTAGTSVGATQNQTTNRGAHTALPDTPLHHL